MRFLPVIERELRVISRNKRLYSSRSAAASVALIIVAWSWMTWAPSASSATMAANIFWTLSGLAFAYCLFLGVFLTADSISEEKREGTLGLLFLTDLRGYDVAIGKLAANSLRAVYSVFAIFPILTIPILLGAVQFADIWRMALVLLSTLFFSLTSGLFVSCCCREDRRAQGITSVVVLSVTVGFPALIMLLQGYFHFLVPQTLLALTPGFAFGTAFGQRYSANAAPFWISIAFTLSLSCIAFVAASVLIHRVWQDRPKNAGEPTWRERFAQWRRGSTRKRSARRRALLDVNGYYWLSARDRLRPCYVLCWLAACAVFWFILWWYNPRDLLEFEAFFVTSIILHTGLKAWVASEAGRQFQEDRKSSALELILSTPITVREILEGQFLGLARQFGAGIVLILAFDVTGLIVGARFRFGTGNEWLLSWVAMMIVFLIDMITIPALAMWSGVSRTRANKLGVKTLFYVLALPWIILAGIFTFLGVMRIGRIDSTRVFIAAYFLVSVAIDALLFANAAKKLTTNFREAASASSR